MAIYQSPLRSEAAQVLISFHIYMPVPLQGATCILTRLSQGQQSAQENWWFALVQSNVSITLAGN
jgi:hypothetical protein